MSEIDLFREVNLSTDLVGIKPAEGPDGGTAFKLKPSKRDIHAGVEQSRELLAVLSRTQTGFVIAATVEQDPRNRGTIVSIDRNQDERAFGFHIDRRTNEAVLQYRSGNFPYDVYFSPLHEGEEVATKAWHTYILEVKSNIATLYVDCEIKGIKQLASDFYRELDPNSEWDLRVGKGLLGQKGIADYRVRLCFINLSKGILSKLARSNRSRI